jgi:hypothetical protein
MRASVCGGRREEGEGRSDQGGGRREHGGGRREEGIGMRAEASSREEGGKRCFRACDWMTSTCFTVNRFFNMFCKTK